MRRGGREEEEKEWVENTARQCLIPGTTELHNHIKGLRNLHNTDLIFSLELNFIDGMSAFIIQAPISSLPLGLMVALHVHIIQGH